MDVTIHEVHREVQSRLTAEKLQRYLGEELRERIRRQGVTIVLEDRLPPSRTLEASPSEAPMPGRSGAMTVKVDASRGISGRHMREVSAWPCSSRTARPAGEQPAKAVARSS